MTLLFPAIQSIHLAGIAMLVGSIVLIDLRLLGYALRGYGVSELSDKLTPWRRAGLLIMLSTGPVLFLFDVHRYVRNPAFIVKMVILLVTLVFHFTLQPRFERHGKVIAIVSIMLWTCVVLGGRAIADFDI